MSKLEEIKADCVWTSLEGILQTDFRCPVPFDDKGFFTDDGYEAYTSLLALLAKVYKITGGCFDLNAVTSKLDEISNDNTKPQLF